MPKKSMKSFGIKVHAWVTSGWRRTAQPILGFFALLWFLIRVIPKPQRASYPCQRAAFPMASAFVLWLMAATTSFFSIKGILTLLKRGHKWILSGIAISSIVFSCISTNPDTLNSMANNTEKSEDLNTDADILGTAQGINPGRVVWTHNPEVSSWDGTTGSYWENANTDTEQINRMISDSLQSLTSTHSDYEAWNALFAYNNTKSTIDDYGNDTGYQPGQSIAIKINENNQDNPYARENIAIDALPQMVYALINQLVSEVKVAQDDIYVYDALRPISDPIMEVCSGDFPKVNYIGGFGYPNSLKTDFQWQDDVINYSNGVITDSASKKIPQFLYNIDYIINMAILKSHDSITGVTLCGKNHYGSIGNPEWLHPYTHPRNSGQYSPQVDIMGHNSIGGKTILYMIDGIYGATGPRGCVSAPKRWTSAPFSNDWPSSIFMSQDIVAIDSVGYDFLNAETILRPLSDNYLHEAALANDPPSKTVYDPEKDGIIMDSLGVHEHWNNPEEKLYSKNLNPNATGIELVAISY